MGTLASGSIDLKSLKVAGEGASKYITSIDSNNGIQVHAQNNTDINYVQINADGMEIFNTDGASINPSAVSVAQFGTTARIGKINNVRVEIDEDSFIMLDGSGTEFAHIGSPKDAQLTDTFVYSNSATFTLSNTPSGAVVVKVNDTATTNFTKSGRTITVSDTLVEGDEVTITYTTTTEIKYYSFGFRLGDAGEFSVAEGDNITASGAYSHAEGSYTEAKGYASHAEGEGTLASGTYSHAEGYGSKAKGEYSHAEGIGSSAKGAYSHAEGHGTNANGYGSHTEGVSTLTSSLATFAHAEGSGCRAGGNGAHAEGVSTSAYGAASHSQNYATRANSDYQTAMGKFNEYDNANTYALIIGNGTDDNTRANALTVDWSGNIAFDLAGYQTANSTDKVIYDALVSLGWESEVTL